MVRLIPDSANGSTPERFPGLSPLPWMVLVALVAGCPQTYAIVVGNAPRVKQERRCCDVLPLARKRADIVEVVNDGA